MGCWGANRGVAILVGTHTLLTSILLVDDFLTYHCLFSGWFDFDIHVEAFMAIPSGCHLMDVLTGQYWTLFILFFHSLFPHSKEPRWFGQDAKSPNTLKVSRDYREANLRVLAWDGS